MAQQKSAIIKFALYGAVGFGTGAVIGGSFGLPLEGAFGGAALGLAFQKDRRIIAYLALAGLISFTAGWFFGFYIKEWLSDFAPPFLGHVIRYGLPGALGGAAIGMVLWKKGVLKAALAGFIGFGIPMMIFNALPIDGLLQLMLGEIIGGAFFATSFYQLGNRLEAERRGADVV